MSCRVNMVNLNEVCGPGQPFWSPTRYGGTISLFRLLSLIGFVESMTRFLRYYYFDQPLLHPNKIHGPTVEFNNLDAIMRDHFSGRHPQLLPVLLLPPTIASWMCHHSLFPSLLICTLPFFMKGKGFII